VKAMTCRLPRAVVASLAVAFVLSSVPSAGQTIEPRLVVFEEFMRPT